MNTKPILFSGEMVRALLDGRKTQTRRVVKRQPKGAVCAVLDGDWWMFQCGNPLNGYDRFYDMKCPYGQPGDLLWVRETWQTWFEFDKTAPKDLPVDCTIQYPASYDGWVSKQRPSIHMPRWASRLTLEITNVQVQRVQEISVEDALEEGVVEGRINPRDAFRELWDSINEKRGYLWQLNPWVWALTFEVIHENVDAVIQRLAA